MQIFCDVRIHIRICMYYCSGMMHVPHIWSIHRGPTYITHLRKLERKHPLRVYCGDVIIIKCKIIRDIQILNILTIIRVDHA